MKEQYIMSCSCKKNTIADKRPDEPCIYCAHKHISTARALYDLEIGYRSLNKSDAIGQLILAAWHYDKEHHDLALKCRDCWLKIERLQDCRDQLAALQKTAWKLVTEDRDRLAADGKNN